MFSDKFSLLTLNFKSSTVPVVTFAFADEPGPVFAIKYANVTPMVKTITGYETYIVSKTPVYEDVTTKYYSYKTREYIQGTTDIKWSVYNDTALLTAGYKYTGNKKVK